MGLQEVCDPGCRSWYQQSGFGLLDQRLWSQGQAGKALRPPARRTAVTSKPWGISHSSMPPRQPGSPPPPEPIPLTVAPLGIDQLAVSLVFVAAHWDTLSMVRLITAIVWGNAAPGKRGREGSAAAHNPQQPAIGPHKEGKRPNRSRPAQASTDGRGSKKTAPQNTLPSPRRRQRMGSRLRAA
jgi:hypothetical protein